MDVPKNTEIQNGQKFLLMVCPNPNGSHLLSQYEDQKDLFHWIDQIN